MASPPGTRTRAERSSERVAIGWALETELSQRHGGDRKSEDQGGKFSTLIDEHQGKTRDLVAKATGFGNGKTYEQAAPFDFG